jgi:hypothetical protein
MAAAHDICGILEAGGREDGDEPDLKSGEKSGTEL